MSAIIQSEIISPLLGVIKIGIILRVVIKLIAAHGDDRGFSVAIDQCKKLILAGGIAVCIADIASQIQQCFSGDDLFEGMKRLIREAVSALTFLEVSYVIFIMISTGLTWQLDSDDDGTYRKKMKDTLLIGIFVITATQLISAIFSYF